MNHTNKHPSFNEYMDFCEKQSNAITLESITLLLEPLGIVPIQYRSYEESEGLINMIYMIVCDNGEQLILRVNNPHPLMRQYFTLTHANIIKKLKQQTTIPLPEIVTYDESTNNQINSEYIIFKKLNGRTFTSILTETMKSESLSFQEKFDIIAKYAKECLSYVKQMQSIKLDPPYIGGIGKKSEQIPCPLEGQTSGPFKNYREYAIDTIKWFLEESLELGIKSEKLDSLQASLKTLVNRLIDTENCLEYNMYVSHNDINESNIMVNDQNEIIAILDWDSAFTFPPLLDPFFMIYEWFCYIEDLEMQKALEEWNYKKLEEMQIDYKVKEEKLNDFERFLTTLQLTVYWNSNYWRGKSRSEMKELLVIHRMKKIDDAYFLLKKNHDFMNIFE